jgi:hypothetical protein
MSRPLTIRQRIALRHLAGSLASEDPALAAKLRGGAVADRVVRLGWCRPLVIASVGSLFVVAGTLLALGSSLLLGMALLAAAQLRRQWLRRPVTGGWLLGEAPNRNRQNG